MNLFDNLLKPDYLSILVKDDELTLDGIVQYYVHIDEQYKLDTLIDLYKFVSIGQAIVYCNKKSKADEIFVSSATVDNIEIIDSVTASNLQASGNVVSSVEQVGTVAVTSTNTVTTTNTVSTGTTSTTNTTSSGGSNY